MRAAAYASALARIGLAVDGPELGLADEFASDGPFVLDIGFGAGEALLAMARERPAECVIGVEVHTTGLAAVAQGVEADGITNVRLVEGDALELLARIASDTLDEVRIWFPDPWPKQRQRHRRLVRADVVTGLVDRLHVGGLLHLVTDVPGYSLQIQQVCGAEGRLFGGVVDRPPWRPVTRFEAAAVSHWERPPTTSSTPASAESSIVVATVPRLGQTVASVWTEVEAPMDVELNIEASGVEASGARHGLDVDRAEEWAELRRRYLHGRSCVPRPRLAACTTWRCCAPTSRRRSASTRTCSSSR